MIGNIIGATYSSAHYEEYKKYKNKELFEEAIIEKILEIFPPEIRVRISALPKGSKRMAILSVLDKDRNLFLRIKAFTDKNIRKYDHIRDIVLMLREYVKVGEVEKKKYGEVMTPLELVKDMLNTLPDEVWTNPNLKWLDPANGTGPYPLMVIYRLMNGLSKCSGLENDEVRYKHIIENMIYVCELQPKNMFLYMCALDPWDNYDMNLYVGSFLEEGFDKHMKEVWNIDKFDIVMGNPPYQEMDGGAKASAKPIYNLFTEKSIGLSDKVLFITPSRWFAGGKGLTSFRKMMVESKKIKLINHYEDASAVFGNTVDIPGGVSYFLFLANYEGECLYNNNEVDLSSFDIIVEPSQIPIINKFKDFDNLSKICLGRGDNTFGIQTNDKRLLDHEDSDTFKCHVSKNKGYVKWIKSEYVKNHPKIHHYKVVTAESNGDYPRFGNKFIAQPYEVCSGSYIWFIINNKREADSLLSYLNCKLVNFLLSTRKISQHIKPDTCKWIPLVPFDREWTDEQLFEYFNLTEEEKKLILS